MGGGERNSSNRISQEEEESVDSLVFDHEPENSDEPTSDDKSTQRGFPDWNEFKKCSDSSKLIVRKARRLRDYEEIMQSYDRLKLRVPSLEEAKLKLLRYKPGAWAEDVSCLKMNDFYVPKTTTLILVGLVGSGKSSLVNRILRVFEDDKFMSERAQVSYNCVGDGTLFLHEYVIPGCSKSFCLYDTRGLHEDPCDNYKMIKSWMTEGVRHGEPVLRNVDSSSQRETMKCKARKTACSRGRRMVNFVIFVIDALSVLKWMDGEDDNESRNLLDVYFSCPYLSFRDDKPVVVCTHGDLLSHADRARVRIYLGELLGVPPATQIFDIPDDCHPETKLAVLDMLTYSLMHADNNLPAKSRFPCKVLGVILIIMVCLCLLLWSPFKFGNWRGIWHTSMNVTANPELRPWHEIKHLW